MSGSHEFPISEVGLGSAFVLQDPEFSWTAAHSESGIDAPDRRVVQEIWFVDEDGNGTPIIEEVGDDIYGVSRKWREIEEVSDQYFYDLNLPFELWNQKEGFFKFGVFDDQVERSYDEDTYYANGAAVASFNYSTVADWETHLSDLLPQDLITDDLVKSKNDISYDGRQNISAWYYMVDLPVLSFLTFTGGGSLREDGYLNVHS